MGKKIKSRCIEIRHLKSGAELRNFDCEVSNRIDLINIYIPELKRSIGIKVDDVKEILEECKYNV